MYRIFIGTPSYKWPPDPHFQESIRRIVNDERFDIEYRSVIGDAHIERARAMVLLHFLKEHNKKPFDFFLNVDWDIEFHPDHVFKMCQKADKNGINVIGGPYAYKTTEDDKKLVPVFRGIPNTDMTDDFLLQAEYLGGGFMMVRSQFLLKMCEHYDDELGFNANPDLDKDMTRTCALWNPILISRPDWGNGFREILSEDYSFCRRVADMSEKCWLDLEVILGHWDGAKCYKLDTKEVSRDKG